VKTPADFDFGDDIDLNSTIMGIIQDVCPVVNAYTCNDIDPTYRPFNNFCNNQAHPRWGNPKIAQRRLAQAQWENGMQLVNYNVLFVCRLEVGLFMVCI